MAQNSPGSSTDLGKLELDAPDLFLGSETILAKELHLSIAISAWVSDGEMMEGGFDRGIIDQETR